jgi:type VII secretion protein EccB
MASRRDQLHSYQFMTQRVISAFVMRETDPRQSPLRRGIGAVFGGLMVAVLVAAGFGIYGLLTKIGSNQWKADGAVIIEKETGASFVYLNEALYPTINFASAMLAAGRPNPAVFRVASASLSSVPRRTAVGIPNAPNSLPPAAKRVGLPWTVCAVPGVDAAGEATSSVLLAAATAPIGGRALVDEAMLVKDANQGMNYLLWHGRRHLVQNSRNVIPALFGAVTPVPVKTSWLNSLPVGTDIATVTVADKGKASPAVPGRKIGDVLAARTGSGMQYYLVFDDGVAAISELQKDIFAAKDPVEPILVAQADVNQMTRSGRMAAPGGETQPPPSTPKLVKPATGDIMCAVTRDARSTPTLSVGGAMAGADRAAPTPITARDGVALADGVLVPPGTVATVRALGAPTAAAGPYFVVTDLGIKYPLPSPAVLAMLGYPPAEAVDIPAELLARIPTGPTLDPNEAIRPA